MKETTFLDLLDHLGPEIGTWPDPDSARKLLADSQSARAHYDAAKSVAAALENFGSETDPLLLEALAQRIAADVPKVQQHSDLDSLTWGWPTAVAAMIPLAIAFSVGWSVGVATETTLAESELLGAWLYLEDLEQFEGFDDWHIEDF